MRRAFAAAIVSLVLFSGAACGDDAPKVSIDVDTQTCKPVLCSSHTFMLIAYRVTGPGEVCVIDSKDVSGSGRQVLGGLELEADELIYAGVVAHCPGSTCVACSGVAQLTLTDGASHTITVKQRQICIAGDPNLTLAYSSPEACK
jgi:hypothetical protein